MKKTKFMIGFVLLFMVIGIAAVTTNVIVNMSTPINRNPDDFLVYFSDVKVDGTQDLTLVENEKKLVFNGEFTSVGDKKVISYDVTNASKNYDAEILIDCTESTTYLNISNVFDMKNVLSARSSRTGTLTIELANAVSNETTQDVTCTITANAVERESQGSGDVYGPLKVITFTFDGVEYNAINGMTWEDYINSEFNTYGFMAGTYVMTQGYYITAPTGGYVMVTELIIDGAVYGKGASCCFDAGSKVLMADGTTKNIEDVKVGDMVMSLNEETGDFVAQRVIKTIIKENSDDLVYVNLSNGKRIGMRAYHPLLTTEGWKSLRPELVETLIDVGNVQMLEVGDTLVGYEENVSIVSIEEREDIANYNTYNLSVENTHNYIVEGVVVHNAAGCAS